VDETPLNEEQRALVDRERALADSFARINIWKAKGTVPRCSQEDAYEETLYFAHLGLCDAARAYKEGCGASFATFASVCMHRRWVELIRYHNQPRRKEDRDVANSFEAPNASGEMEEYEPSDPRHYECQIETDLLLEQAFVAQHFSALAQVGFRGRQKGELLSETAHRLGERPKTTDNATQRAVKKLKRYFALEGLLSPTP
jgi:DNA-directed RNA polymerase specialized sigma24 family protein